MSRDAHDSRTDPANSAPSSGLRCWFCSHRLELEYVRRDGLLRGRDDRQGGPYRLYDCPICNRSNHCEKTKKGRWFSSPTFQPNLLDYIVGKLITPAQEFLRAAAWYRENEERRCYFFERDGDLRYSSGAWLRRWLAPAGNDDDKIDEKRRHTEREQERGRSTAPLGPRTTTRTRSGLPRTTGEATRGTPPCECRWLPFGHEPVGDPRSRT